MNLIEKSFPLSVRRIREEQTRKCAEIAANPFQVGEFVPCPVGVKPVDLVRVLNAILPQIAEKIRSSK